MWRSRRKSSTEIDTTDGSTSIRRSYSNLNFVRSSLKDVENLLAEDDANGFNKSIDQPPPCSITATATATATARRLSVFRRVHLANKFARAFSTIQSPNSEKSPADSNITAAAEKLGKSDRFSTKQSPNSQKISPDSNITATAEKLAKSDRFSTKQSPNSDKSPPDSNTTAATNELKELKKSDRVISLPGAEKRVILYTTSLRVVRPTFEACRTVQSILRGFRVSIDERDVSMDSRFLDELQSIMAECDEIEKTKLNLPRVFIGGKYIGGAEEVKQLHETGELKKVVERLPAVVAGVCEVCGDFRFIVCDECSGSRKCYSEKGGFRSCTLCNENGLIRCPSCLGR